MRDGALDRATVRALARRTANPVRAGRGPAIKRHQHEIDVACPADRFAAALREVLIEPGAAFGLVRLRRAPDRVGRPFAAGERFHGCFDLERAAAAAGAPSWLRRALAAAARRGLIAWLEQRIASDHGEITELTEHQVAYRYLAGTPIAGESRYTIRPLGRDACRVEQLFCWQERGPLAVALLHGFGVRAHDQVVLAQMQAAAARCGAPLLRHTVRQIASHVEDQSFCARPGETNRR
ncbi:MAG TPA: hypothetical protein VL172_16255 [Kofleriaceae bacterium]|nr:hypothetical protein [Kofleriaceae bacterium]